MVFGMAHRGRLNVLGNLLNKPYEYILAEFEGASHRERSEEEGDVKYHLGYSYDHTTPDGHTDAPALADALTIRRARRRWFYDPRRRRLLSDGSGG
jgi:2-oxoglutarate dehydrogenase complex dehydrogenase (E1) component-like enzyme